MTLDDHLRELVRAVVREELAAKEHEPQHITIAEYAKRWSISESTVRQAIRDGRLEAEHIGRTVRIQADAKIQRRDRSAHARLRLLGGGR